jgi:hypothetical protein
MKKEGGRIFQFLPSSFFLPPPFSAASFDKLRTTLSYVEGSLEQQALFLFSMRLGPHPQALSLGGYAPRSGRGASYCTRVIWPRTTPPGLAGEWKFT